MYFEQALCHRVFGDILCSAYPVISLFLDRMFAQSRIFYENNMILRFVLSDPAKSSLESSAWIRLPEQRHTKKHYHYEKISPLFFSVQCIIKTHVIPQYTSCYFCHLGRHLGYFTRLKYNNIMPVKFAECNFRKKVINCNFDFKWGFALKWRPSWTPS